MKMTPSVSMTICQIGAFHLPSGKTPTNADSLRVRLAELGIDSVCASTHTAPLARASDMAATLVRQRRRFEVVLLHVYSGRAFLWSASTALLAGLLRKRLVLWLHGGNLPTFYRHHRQIVFFVFRHADVIVAPSPYLATAFQADFPVRILPYDLPVGVYPFRQRNETRPSFLWLRAFNAGYNPSMAPEVLETVVQDYSKARLVMCGPDTGDGSLQATQRRCQQLGVAECVEFPGLVTKERIRELGAECDIFLNTTNYDNTPVSVIEAMAMGMCVVSTCVGGIPYLIEDEQDGLLVPPNDPAAMATACLRLLRQPDLAQHLSANARKKAESFDWTSAAPQWQTLLASLHRQNLARRA